jgi:hypothetical protein
VLGASTRPIACTAGGEGGAAALSAISVDVWAGVAAVGGVAGAGACGAASTGAVVTSSTFSTVFSTGNGRSLIDSHTAGTPTSATSAAADELDEFGAIAEKERHPVLAARAVARSAARRHSDHRAAIFAAAAEQFGEAGHAGGEARIPRRVLEAGDFDRAVDRRRDQPARVRLGQSCSGSSRSRIRCWRSGDASAAAAGVA